MTALATYSRWAKKTKLAEQAYEIYASGMKVNEVELPSWCQLSEADRDAWREVVDFLRRV
jgi:hypothetical protein